MRIVQSFWLLNDTPLYKYIVCFIYSFPTFLLHILIRGYSVSRWVSIPRAYLPNKSEKGMVITPAVHDEETKASEQQESAQAFVADKQQSQNSTPEDLNPEPRPLTSTLYYPGLICRHPYQDSHTCCENIAPNTLPPPGRTLPRSTATICSDWSVSIPYFTAKYFEDHSCSVLIGWHLSYFQFFTPYELGNPEVEIRLIYHTHHRFYWKLLTALESWLYKWTNKLISLILIILISYCKLPFFPNILCHQTFSFYQFVGCKMVPHCLYLHFAYH